MSKYIVNCKKKGDFTSISEALEAASDGDEIFIKKGTYNERLAINKAVTITGDKKVVVSLENGILCTVTACATISNILFKNTNTTEKKESEFGMIGIYSDCIFDNCDFSGSFDSGILVEGDNIKPVIRNSVISKSRRNGFYFLGSCGAVIENCEIFDNEHHGCVFSSTSEACVKDCKIYKNGKNGAFFNENSQGKIEGCEIMNNKFCGIIVTDNGNPSVSNCKIFNNENVGIYCNKDSVGAFSKCEIYNCPAAGIDLFNNCSSVFKDCHIHNFAKTGVIVNNKAKPEFENCQISDCVSDAAFGLILLNNCSGIYKGCKIYNISGIGISVQNYVNPLVEECEIFDCFPGFKTLAEGIAFSNECSGTYKNCKIHNILGNGVLIRHNSCPNVEGFEIYQCTGLGETRAVSSAVKMANSGIVNLDNLVACGMNFIDTSSGVFKNCNIHSMMGYGVKVSGEAHPNMENCQIYDFKELENFVDFEKTENCGIYLNENGCGVYKKCVIYDIKGIGIYMGSTFEAAFDECDIHDIDGEEVKYMEMSEGE